MAMAIASNYQFRPFFFGDFQHIIYRTFGTSVVLKMPACPDRIRIRAHIMKWFLFSQNNCGFIKTAVIAVIFQNRRWTRARKPHT